MSLGAALAILVRIVFRNLRHSTSAEKLPQPPVK
jgi:hypothetical protein